MRLFIGIPLSDQIRSDLERVVARLQPGSDGWRWSSPEGWHITLQFLGKTTPEQLAQLTPRLAAIQSPSIPTKLGQLDLFDRAGVLFTDVIVSPLLLALQQKVVAATTPCGFIAETRPYHPHITLARFKGDGLGKAVHHLRLQITDRHRFPSFTANAFLLYESFPGPAGSRYEVRESFTFAQS
jgi:2'-5' RNA ligase